MATDLKPELEADQVVPVLIAHFGNIIRAADELGIDSAKLRAFITNSPILTAVQQEIMEGAVDEAVTVLHDGLRDEGSYQNRFYAAKEFLKTNAARKRGFGFPRAEGLEINNAAGGQIYIKWIEPSEGDDRKLIEAKANPDNEGE